jgi:hypothetical protein
MDNHMIKLTTDKAAVVDTKAKWIPVSVMLPPRGAKVLVIEERFGVARLDNWHPESGVTHWFPLPTFLKDD